MEKRDENDPPFRTAGMSPVDENGRLCRSCNHQQVLPSVSGPDPCPSVFPRHSARAVRWCGAPAGAASVTTCRISHEVSPPVEAGRKASLRRGEKRGNLPTRLPAHPGNRVSGKLVYRLLREKNPPFSRGCPRRGRCLLSLRSFSGPPTPCGAPAVFRRSRWQMAEAGSALRSGIGTPSVSVGMRAGELPIPHLSADIPGSAQASMPRSCRCGPGGWARGRVPAHVNRLHQPDRVSARRAVQRRRRTVPCDWRPHDAQSRARGTKHPSLPREADMHLRNRVPQIAMCAQRGNPRRQSHASS